MLKKISNFELTCGVGFFLGLSYFFWFKRKRKNAIELIKQINPEIVVKLTIALKTEIFVVSLSSENADESEGLLKMIWNDVLSDKQSFNCVGLDAEWRPERESERNLHHRVATLQIATRHYAVVIQLLHTRESCFPPSLKGFLQDERVLKVGMGIEEDCRRLAIDYNIKVSRIVDLRAYGEEIGVNCQGGLAGLSEKFIGLSLNKELQCSNWAQRQLSKEQIEYAALDAWVSVEVFHNFPIPPQGVHALCKKISRNIDPATCENSWNKTKAKTRDKAVVEKSATNTRKLTKPSRHPARKSQLYENCRMLAPDGACLTTCSKKKIDWYVSKGLAEYEDDERSSIRLFFEPKGRSVDGGYHLSDKENRCCVCGKEEHYLRHHVVPHCYRQHFPESMKTHLSHDIVLMCLPCHTTCSKYDQERMAQLGKLYDAPLGGVGGKKVSPDKTLMTVKKHINALIRHSAHMPPEKKIVAISYLEKYFNIEEENMTLEFLTEQNKQINPWITNDAWISHASKVLAHLQTNPEGLQNFVFGWREHFLRCMNPKHLPPFWNIKNRVVNSSYSKIDDNSI